MSRRALRLWLAGCGVLALSCSGVRLPGKAGELLRTVETATLASEERSQCEKLDTLPSVEEEYALGGAVALNWVQRGGGLLPVATHEKLLRYLNIVGQNLAAQSERPTLRWTFGILRNETAFDALSAPGGYVFVTLGLLQGVENEAQLAGVLAHEIAHITSKHALTRYNEVKVNQCKVAVTIKAGKVLGQGETRLSSGAVESLAAFAKGSGRTVDLDQDAGLLSSLTDGLVDTVIAKGFGKEDEFAADALAVSLLLSAGYDPREYIEFLGKIPDSRSGFANHPRKVDRVKKLVALLEAPKGSGEDFPELAANPEELVQPPLPPEFASAKDAMAHDKP